MPLLYGLHDREGCYIVPAGGWCVDTVALSENPPPTDYAALRGDINWIVRLNLGYGSTGTIPLPIDYDKFAALCANYVAKSRGANIWIIGNEPNHENERPNGIYITFADYARCFTLCRNAIKRVNPNTQVIPAPCAPYHATPVSWLEYWHMMLEMIAANGGCDGIAIHAYTRSSNPDDINDDARMGPPLEDTCSGFLTYQDALEVVPQSLRHLPAYLTEFNELLPEGWHDVNNGVVQEAYRHIDWWNTHAADANEPKFQCLILYRWPKFDQWRIEGKQGVIDDFKAAVGRGYQSPPVNGSAVVNQNFLPFTPNQSPSVVPTPDLPPREFDPRAMARGVAVGTPTVAPGQQFWFARRIVWLDEQQSQGRHHILGNVFRDGVLQANVPLLIRWPDGTTPIKTEDKSRDTPPFNYWYNYGMSPSLNEFSVKVDDGTPSEIVERIGMGANGNSHLHTSTVVEWELVTEPQAQPQPQPTQPGKVPALAHPVADPRWRKVTQAFGSSTIDYSRFKVDGVPLRGHNGIDFGTPEGTTIDAVDDGSVVENAIDPEGYGRYVKLVHAWGESLYAHLALPLADVGKIVKRGEQIGISGSTGNVDGPHLHFAMRVAPFNRADGWGGYTDPAPYLINTGAPSQPQPTNAWVGVLDGAYIRNAPQTGDVLIAVPYGERVTVLGTDDATRWANVQYQGVTGWMSWLLLRWEPMPARPTPVEPTPSGDKWQRTIAFILKEEGGYTANDEGAPTNFGINQGANPDLDVASITREQAIERHRTKYWQGSGADKLEWPFCLFVMNASVQAGQEAAAQMVSESGGHMLRFQGLFQLYYSRINQDSWERNGKAWMARCGRILVEASKP